MALVVSLTYLCCPAWLLVFLGSTLAPALGWVEDPGHSPPPFLLQLPAPRVLQRDLPWRMSPPLGLEKLHASLAYRSLGIGHASLEASPGVAVAIGTLAFSRFCSAGCPA